MQIVFDQSKVIKALAARGKAIMTVNEKARAKAED